MILASMGLGEYIINASHDTEFCELSFAIESGLSWYFGRGVNAIHASRSKDASNVVVKIKPLVEAKQMRFSHVTAVGVMAKEGYWPLEVPFDKVWRVPGLDRQEIRDGQHRVFSANKEGTLMQQWGLIPETPIGEIAYGLADLIVGFFWQGAKWVKHQSSMGKIQTMTDLGFEGDGLRRYLTDPDPGYSVHQKIGTMPR